MKDQYVADLSDYLKYSLLRSVQRARRGRLLVCWMRTVGDDRGDGQLTGYLGDPDRYRAIDPPLFDELSQIVSSGERRVEAVERARLIPRTEYFRATLEDGLSQRESFMERLQASVVGHDLVFFDPDNGLDVPSVTIGRAGSSRYLYRHELPSLLDRRSAIIYQHFPREDRAAYVARRLAALSVLLPTHELFAAYGNRVAYLFAAAAGSGSALRSGTTAMARRWAGALRVVDP